MWGEGNYSLRVIAVVALMVFSVVFWKEILIWYYEVELRKEPNRLIRFLGEPPSSAKRLALSRFFLTPEGKKRLVKKYLEACLSADGNFKERLERVRTSEDKKWHLTWTSAGKYNHWTYTDRPDWSFRGGGSRGSLGSKMLEGMSLAWVLETLQDSLLEVGCDRYPIPDDPQLTISVVTREGNEQGILGSKMTWNSFPEGRVCLIERVDRQWPRSLRGSSSLAIFSWQDFEPTRLSHTDVITSPIGSADVASRQVPESSIWLRAVVAVAAAGIAPGIAIFITGLLIRNRGVRQ